MTVAVMRGFPTTHSAFEPSSPSALREGSNRLPQHQGLPTASRNNQEPMSLSLPPIREALSFYYSGPPDSTAGSSRATSVPSGPQRLSHSPRTANEPLAGLRDNTYVLSNDNEREREMRMSYGDADREREREERYGQNQIPRGYSSGLPYHHLDHHGESSGMTEGAATASVGSSPPSSSAYSTMADGDAAWSSSRRYTDTASHYPGSGRPSLPALPHMDDHHAHQQSRPSHASHAPQHHSHGSGPAPYQQHPSRAQSLSGGSIGSFDRAVFPPSASSSGPIPSAYDHRHSSRSSSSSYHRHQQDSYHGNSDFRGRGMSGGHGYGGMGGQGSMMSGVNGRMGDSKQRKRRGNLPKETTDKLRAWFSEHLHHPYPSEDEKQDLMTQTGLQMNQISNWFINARRRHLPAMINNARAVNGAMAGSGHGAGSGSMGSAMGGLGGGMDAGRGSANAKGYMPANERMYASPERMYGSFERPLEPRPSSIYTGSEHHHRVDPRRISPSSDDDY